MKILGKKNISTSWFEESLKFRGTILEEPGYHVWGTSAIQGDKGKTHLFSARWPIWSQFDPGWRTHSEIAHYIGDTPEGPFKFNRVVVKGSGSESWDKVGAHNPLIKKFGDTYALLYISNTGIQDHPANQTIGMRISNSLSGPWKKVGNNGQVLAPPSDPKFWNYKAPNGVNNPAMIQHPNGKFYLYFKSMSYKMGVAIAEHLEGPYSQLNCPVTSGTKTIEDGYAFTYKSKIYLLTTDNHGILLRGGLIIWESVDGLRFFNPQIAARLASYYLKRADLYHRRKMQKIYGDQPKFERPQILMQNNLPAYLYVPSGYNFEGKKATACHLFKINL